MYKVATELSELSAPYQQYSLSGNVEVAGWKDVLPEAGNGSG